MKNKLMPPLGTKEIFPGLLGRIVDTFSPATEASPVSIASQFLGNRCTSGFRLRSAIQPRAAASRNPRRITRIRGRAPLLALAAAGDFRLEATFRPDL